MERLFDPAVFASYASSPERTRLRRNMSDAVSVIGPTSVELFAGGGGMSLGLHLAGFRHLALVEWEHRACETLRRNAGVAWELQDVIEGDVRDFVRHLRDGMLAYEDVDVLAGGPPCQPFSLGGRHAGDSDERNMFPAALDAVRELAPKAVVFENVPGLARTSFKPYFDYVVNQLREPTVTPREGEDWRDHAARVTSSACGPRSLRYRVLEPRVLNSADLGVPQARRRVFIVAVRADLEREWSWDDFELDHSREALFYDQWVEPTYWEEHGLGQPTLPGKVNAARLDRLRDQGRPAEKRWRTVRDMLREPTSLPEPVDWRPHPEVPNHVGIPGARSYAGHTGSDIDLPSKTIKAGVHGVCGGEAMIRFRDGSLRYLTVRESARAQSFPDWYEFVGARSTAMRHIGNAVAVDVAQAVGLRLRALLNF